MVAAIPRDSYNPDAATPARLTHTSVWAVPRSLAATWGISFDFYSSGYLDVSIPPVTFSRPMYSGVDN